MTQPWNMAKLRSRELPRKYKPVGPVGRDVSNTVIAGRPLPAQEQRYHKDRILTDGFGGQYFRDGAIVRGEFPACDDCGYHVCGCHDFVTWSDGTKHRCVCSGRGAAPYALDTDCQAHEHVQHPERFPDQYCAKHKQWKNAKVCGYCLCEKHSAPMGVNSATTEKARQCMECQLYGGHSQSCSAQQQASGTAHGLGLFTPEQRARLGME